MDEQLERRVSGWVRQNRFRATKYGCFVLLDLSEILEIYKDFDEKCAYCGDPTSSPDFAFPIKHKAPCVPANVLPCCDECKIKKNNRDIIVYCKSGGITKDALRTLIVKLVARTGGDRIRDYMKKQLSPQEKSSGQA